MNNEQIIEAIKVMTVLELNELVKACEEEFGVSAAAPAAVAAAGGEVADEQTEFDVILANTGAKKIAVIKAVREITGLGLKDAKGLVDAAPSTIKEALPKEEAEAVKAKLEAAGAAVEMK